MCVNVLEMIVVEIPCLFAELLNGNKEMALLPAETAAIALFGAQKPPCANPSASSSERTCSSNK